MDPFEVRMQFLALLRRLSASQQSIQKVAGFALKYFSQCGEDLWDCILEECQKGSINHRMNIFYFLDSLCETSNTQPIQQQPNSGPLYVDYLSRDLLKLVDSVVPAGRLGLPNVMSTRQILDSWRTKRLIDPQLADDVLQHLQGRSTTDPDAQPSPSLNAGHIPEKAALSKNEITDRIEEDRERHKRLRERRWVQPISHHPLAQIYPPPPATFFPLDSEVPVQGQSGNGWAPGEELTLDIEFENEWETTSDWNEDDDEAVLEENALCFVTESDSTMDLK